MQPSVSSILTSENDLYDTRINCSESKDIWSTRCMFVKILWYTGLHLQYGVIWESSINRQQMRAISPQSAAMHGYKFMVYQPIHAKINKHHLSPSPHRTINNYLYFAVIMSQPVIRTGAGKKPMTTLFIRHNLSLESTLPVR